MAKVALLGHGVVGSGVAELLMKNAGSIAKRAGEEIEIKYILDIRDFPGLEYSDRFVRDYDVIEHDPEIEVVIEVIGGIKPAYEFVSRAILAGKSVVTSNKELVAARGAQLLELATQNGVKFLFEASVGGGIPIIRPMHQCLAANELDGITGILNGTTNYILTKMAKDHAPFDETLKTAQQLGYAESNPAADIEGTDACRKICILASLAFGRHIYPEYVHTEGITRLSSQDMAAAAAMGATVKLLGVARKAEDGRVFILVAPFVVPHDHVLANVEDVFNGILVTGDAIGEVTFFGRGAGKLPTASAVVADIIDCVKHRAEGNNIQWKDPGTDITVDYKTVKIARLVRIPKQDRENLIKKAVLREVPSSVPEECWIETPPITEVEYINMFGQVHALSMLRIIGRTEFI